jgi:ubiquinone biosynthesis protein UbiJ
MQDIKKLIDDLLAHELRPNTREDLSTWRQELAAGTLSAGDERYIRALHERVVGGGAPKAKKRDDDEEPVGTGPTELARLQAEVAKLTAERDQLQGTVAALRQEIETLKAGKA